MGALPPCLPAHRRGVHPARVGFEDPGIPGPPGRSDESEKIHRCEKMKRSLGTIQRWMQESIIGKQSDGLGEFIKSPNIGPKAGMQIYIHAYRSRLIECMKKEYSILLHALGEKAFELFAEDYLETYPPRSYTLALLGERFPQYLKETKPETASAWEEFIIELAELERNFFEVFDAPGSEGKKLPRRLPDTAMRVVPVPCLRLLEFKYPVSRYFIQVRKGRNPGIPRARRTFMAMSRRDYIVRFYDMDSKEFGILKDLMRGKAIPKGGRGYFEHWLR